MKNLINKILYAAFGITAAALLVLTAIKVVRIVKQPAGCQSYAADEVALAMFRSDDESYDHLRCNDDPACWSIIGENKYTGYEMYRCKYCGRAFEMVPGTGIESDYGDFIKMPLSDEDLAERQGW